jgi:hypothetical protein
MAAAFLQLIKIASLMFPQGLSQSTLRERY